jgi:hypothetical protein
MGENARHSGDFRAGIFCGNSCGPCEDSSVSGKLGERDDPLSIRTQRNAKNTPYSVYGCPELGRRVTTDRPIRLGWASLRARSSVPQDGSGYVVGDGRRVASAPDHRCTRNPVSGGWGLMSEHDSVVANPSMRPMLSNRVPWIRRRMAHRSQGVVGAGVGGRHHRRIRTDARHTKTVDEGPPLPGMRSWLAPGGPKCSPMIDLRSMCFAQGFFTPFPVV